MAWPRFIELVQKSESSDDLILPAPWLRRPAHGHRLRMLSRYASPVLLPVDGSLFQAVVTTRSASCAGAQLPFAATASPYVNRIKSAGEAASSCCRARGSTCSCSPSPDAVVVPPFTHARQGMIDEHIAASAPFKGVRLNTSYSYGIDDQDFVVAFDSDYPQEFVDLVGGWSHGGEPLTQRDTPMFACAKAPIDAILAQLATWISDLPDAECPSIPASSCCTTVYYRASALAGWARSISPRTSSGPKLALKIVSARLSQDDDRLRRFQWEARSVSALNHPNVITIFDIGEADGRHFIATEFVDGQTLRAQLNGGRFQRRPRRSY